MIITESKKSGRGYTSGEFDIKDDGSLIINTVSLRHDISFAVNVLYTSDGDPNIENVRVIVYVEPEHPYPVIDGCDRNAICYQTSNMEYTATCSVQDSRPPANLTLLLKTPKGDSMISSNETVFSNSILYTSRIQATITFNETNRLLLLYCRGGILPHSANEAMILIENNQSGLLPVHERLNVGVGSKVTLSCGKHNASYFVWRKKGQENAIAVGLGSVYGNITDIYSNEFQLTDHNNILVISSFERKHNGIYICVYGDGSTTGTRVFEITIDDTARANPTLILLMLCTIVVVVVAVVVVVVLFIQAKRKKTRSKPMTHKTELKPMLTKNPTSEELKEYLSSNDVSFNWDESKKKKKKYNKDHNRMIQWLKQASKEGIEVRCVRLLNCFVSVDDSAEHILLASGEWVPVITSLKSLILHQSKETLVEMKDLEKIVQYATKCAALLTLQFTGFGLPFISKECSSLCDMIQKSEITVEWVSQTQMGTLRINSQECCWEENQGQLSKSSYDKMKEEIMRRVELTEPMKTSVRHV